ncbi:ubiquitin-conjugating enzyme [Cyclospora cayetanensis]|uniref:Ubiquitin-conjugating enzyme n=1 Tax=Cyclospora cayetanensis TaxID=88456 RepID=A0A1D3D3I6_9EIME|nr:ubiquitin-conjugating enzyme [Cyclospora cayetanensis]
MVVASRRLACGALAAPKCQRGAAAKLSAREAYGRRIPAAANVPSGAEVVKAIEAPRVFTEACTDSDILGAAANTRRPLEGRFRVCKDTLETWRLVPVLLYRSLRLHLVRMQVQPIPQLPTLLLRWLTSQPPWLQEQQERRGTCATTSSLCLYEEIRPLDLGVIQRRRSFRFCLMARVFPANYPFAPPSISMVTPNGRFEVNTRLCTSFSDFHPELWNPSWKVETLLTGFVSFMLDERSSGSVGCINTSAEHRMRLARESAAACIANSTFRRLFPEFIERVRTAREASAVTQEACALNVAAADGQRHYRMSSRFFAGATSPVPSPYADQLASAGAAGVTSVRSIWRLTLAIACSAVLAVVFGLCASQRFF